MRFIVLYSMVATCFLTAGDWPRYGGPYGDGSAAAPGLFDDEVKLKQLWKVPLGSGFSSVVVSNGRVYAMHQAGDKDAMSSFDAKTGKKLWSNGYGPAFPKVGNSEPGPLSTPVIDGERVYGLGAYGELFCLNAKTGEKIWQRHLKDELGAVVPEVGMGSSPLVSGGHLIINVGDQKNKSIAAFDKKTGELNWAYGHESVRFQSPALVTLNGKEQLIAMSSERVRSIEPSSGRILWERKSRDWLQMIAIGEDLMLFGQYHGLALHQLRPKDGLGMGQLIDPTQALSEDQVHEKWYNERLELEYDMPVHHKGYLYGFKGNFFTCLKLDTGEKMWSSRETGMGMAILVDGHLAIMGYDGVFRIAVAWHHNYKERGLLKVFEKGGLTQPSYADGVFFVRNYTHLAAIKVN